MKINFTLDRFDSVCDVVVAEVTKEVGKNPQMLLKDADSIVAQFQTKLNAPDFAQTVKHIQLGFTLLPFDSVALLLAIGYKMGADDVKAAGEIAELEKLFANPVGSQEEKDAK